MDITSNDTAQTQQAGPLAAACIRATKARVRRFFHTPSGALEVQALADFLQYPAGTPIYVTAGNPQEQLAQSLAGVRFRRLADAVPSPNNDILALDTLIAQSNQQNRLTGRFLQLLEGF